MIQDGLRSLRILIIAGFKSIYGVQKSDQNSIPIGGKSSVPANDVPWCKLYTNDLYGGKKSPELSNITVQKSKQILKNIGK